MKRMSCSLSILWIQRCLGENHIIKVIYGAHAFRASYYYLSMLFKRTKKHLFDTIHLKMQCNPFASIILCSVSLSLFGRVLLRRLATKLRTLKRLNMCGFCVVNIDHLPFFMIFFLFFILLLLLLLSVVPFVSFLKSFDNVLPKSDKYAVLRRLHEIEQSKKSKQRMHEWDAVNEEEHCKCSGISSKINKHILSTGDILVRMDENVCECEYVYVRI